MQIFGIMRGIHSEMQITKEFLRSQMFNWNVKNPKGQTIQHQVQGAYRPWELFEYTFPEPCLPEVLYMMGITNPDGDYGKIHQAKHLALLRRMLGAEKIPKLDIKEKDLNTIIVDKKEFQRRFIPRRAVAIHAIGLKKDEYRTVDGGNYQEAL